MTQNTAEFTFSGDLYRMAAFTTDSSGGNPAGVWIGNTLPDQAAMQQIAARVGFSETAFIVPGKGQERTIRYYSPEKEIAFCGHATIATGVLLGELEGDGIYHLASGVGPIVVSVDKRLGFRQASLTSVEPQTKLAPSEMIKQALDYLGWKLTDLDPTIPAILAYAGAWHLVLAAAKKERLATLSYDFDALKKMMLQEDITTLQLIWRETPTLFHARNPFPVGGIVEDPATGAAAAALGGYFRSAGIMVPPVTFTILQGEAMGRPSKLSVEVPVKGGIIVSGTAVHL